MTRKSSRHAPPTHMHHIELITRLEDQHLSGVEELIALAKQADGHEPLGEHKFLRIKHGSDVALAFLAYEDKRLAGYGHTLIFESGGERRVSCELIVHPEFRRQNVGATILQRIIEHAEAEGASRLDLWAYNHSQAGQAIATEFGFEETRRLLHMHRHPGPPPVPARPEGASVRPFRPGEDDEMWLALNNRIFAGHPENGEWTMEDFQARMRQPWFNPNDLLILEVDGEPAGFHWLKVEERESEGLIGEVYIIGTAPEYHGRGLGRYLLAEGLTHLSERGVAAVVIYVDQSNERAVALYWAMEFHHHHVDVLYSLGLPTGSQSSRATAATG